MDWLAERRLIFPTIHKSMYFRAKRDGGKNNLTLRPLDNTGLNDAC
jgi:hypothetical protein